MSNQEISVNLFKQSKRNTGLDLLKIISMICVVMLHVLWHGGVLKSTIDMSINYEISWGLESLAYCAVNTYVMITGFLYAGRKRRISNLVEFWIEVLFYSVIISFFLFFAGFDVKKYYLVWCFFPVLSNQYWFFNQYFVLFLFIPFLNMVCADKQSLKTILLSAICVFSILPIFGRGDDLFRTREGYSVFWFVFLYWTGAYIKMYHLPDWLKRHAGSVYLVSVFTMLFSRNILHISLLNKIGYNSNLFYSYTSPLVYICAVCLISLFSEISIKSHGAGEVIKKIASLTFGVYLIHENQHIRRSFIAGKFISFASESAALMVFHILSTALMIFVVCCLIDYLRSLLFKLINVKEFAVSVGNWAENKWDNTIHWLNNSF